jgi:hypothetical protein
LEPDYTPPAGDAAQTRVHKIRAHAIEVTSSPSIRITIYSDQRKSCLQSFLNVDGHSKLQIRKICITCSFNLTS